MILGRRMYTRRDRQGKSARQEREGKFTREKENAEALGRDLTRLGAVFHFGCLPIQPM